MHIHKFHDDRILQPSAEGGIASGGLWHGVALASGGHRIQPESSLNFGAPYQGTLRPLRAGRRIAWTVSSALPPAPHPPPPPPPPAPPSKTPTIHIFQLRTPAPNTNHQRALLGTDPGGGIGRCWVKGCWQVTPVSPAGRSGQHTSGGWGVPNLRQHLQIPSGRRRVDGSTWGCEGLPEGQRSMRALAIGLCNGTGTEPNAPDVLCAMHSALKDCSTSAHCRRKGAFQHPSEIILQMSEGLRG